MTRVLQFQTQKILKSLKTIIASVHVVAEEDILYIRYLASLFEEFQQIVELTVNVTANCDWCAQMLEVAF